MYLEIRVDAYKFLTSTRRPIPVAASSIGTWQTIYLVTAITAVITNSGLLVFTLHAFDYKGVSAGDLMWIFYTVGNGTAGGVVWGAVPFIRTVLKPAG